MVHGGGWGGEEVSIVTGGKECAQGGLLPTADRRQKWGRWGLWGRGKRSRAR